MSKKGKKRPLNDGEVANDHVSSNQNKESDKKLHKNKKLKVKADDEPKKKVKSEVKLIKKQSNNDDILDNIAGLAVVEKIKKLKKKKKNKKKSKMDKNSDVSENLKDDSDKLRKIKDGKVDGSKKKERYKIKRQNRLEARKAVRQEEGQHSSIMKMSVGELKKKIDEIESRENISKTALRKLRVLKIKLKVEEGTVENEQSSEQKNKKSKNNIINESKVPKDKSRNEKNPTHTSPKSPKNDFKNKNPTTASPKSAKNDIKNNNPIHTSPKSNKKNYAKPNEAQNYLFIEDRVGNKLENSEGSVTKSNLSKKELKNLKKEEIKKAKLIANKLKETNQVKVTNTKGKNKSIKDLSNDKTNKSVKSPKNSKVNQNAKKANLKVDEDYDKLDKLKNKVSANDANDSDDNESDDSEDGNNEYEDGEIVSDEDDDDDQDDDKDQDDDNDQDDDESELDIKKIINKKVSKKGGIDNKKDKKKGNRTKDDVSTDKLKENDDSEDENDEYEDGEIVSDDDDDDDQDDHESEMDINKIIISEKGGIGNKKDKKKGNHIKDNASTDKPKNEKTDKLKKEKQKEGTEETTNKKIRYVLFVGNLNYETTTVDLKKHFLTKVDKVKDVRIPSKPKTNTPRGFGYVEFENSVDYEKGLSLHRTTLNGRPINVMYTTHGSKKANKKQEIIHKNKKLHAMRKKGMLAGSKKDTQKRSFRRNFNKQLKKD